MGNSESKSSLSDAVQMGACGTNPYTYLSFDESEIPRGLKFSMKFLTVDQFHFCQRLCEAGQDHLFDDWEFMDTKNRVALVEQLMRVDRDMENVGGLLKYISTGKKLLDASNCDPERISMQLLNPALKGWRPTVPAEGDIYNIGTPEYSNMESKGMPELARVGFCIAALETCCHVLQDAKSTRPKFLLPVEITTGRTFLQHCIEHIMAISKSYELEQDFESLPLCIMTSPETDGPIRDYLEKFKYFGMPQSSITILNRSSGVPGFFNSDGRIALDPDDASLVLLDSRGHGDFHALLYESKTALKWLKQRRLKWMYMIEHETNGLAFHPLPLMLGVSKERRLIMNSLTVPRKAKDSTLGAVCAMKNLYTSFYKTSIVESHELDALLRVEGYEEGEVNAENGFSPFQGTTNQIVFDLETYVEIMELHRGQIPKVISPIFDNTVGDEDEDEEFLQKSAFGKNLIDSKKTETIGWSKKGKQGRRASVTGKVVGKRSGKSSHTKVYEFVESAPIQSRMQDFAQLLTSSKQMQRLGFTNLSRASLAFSPIVYSNADDDVTVQERRQLQLPPYTASTAEADQYGAARMLLQALGCTVETPESTVYAGDICVIPGPSIVLEPFFGFCLSQLKSKFPTPDKVRIGAESTLIVQGEKVVVTSLDLDGCLLIYCAEGGRVNVHDKKVHNKGWEKIESLDAPNEIHRMRGYLIQRHENEIIEMETSTCGLF